MRSILMEDLLNYRFLSGVRIAPDGKHVVFVVKQAKREWNDYRSDIYLAPLDNGQAKRLTSSGRDGPLVWAPNGHEILFISRREGNNEKSPLYLISIDGGEAERIGTISHKVEALELIDEKHLLYTAEISLNDEAEGDAEDYEVLDEIPFWQNGKGFTNRRRTHLFRFDMETGREQELVSGPLNVTSFNHYGTMLAFIVKALTDKAPITDELWLLDLASGTLECLSKEEYAFDEVQFLSKELIAVLGTDMHRYGLRQSREVLALDLRDRSRHIKSLTPEWDRTPSRRVMSDCRLGSGPISRANNGWLYLSIIERGNSYLDAVNREGSVKRIVGSLGSIDSFDVQDGKVVFVALREGKLQELYLSEEMSERQLTDLNTENLVDRAISVPEPFTVVAKDETKLDAWLMKPKAFEESKKYPAILAIHGGPNAAYGSLFFHEMQVLSGRGYVVFFCNPRGSAGRGDTFYDIRGKYGTVDYSDLMSAVDYALKRFPFIDADHLGVMGGSYGGFMVNWAIGHTDRFRAACSQRSISNWIFHFCTADLGYFFGYDQMKGTPWGKDTGEKLWWHSPLRYANRVKTPTLFINADEDYRSRMGGGIQMFTALRYHGIESRLVLFQGENHDLSRTGKPLHRLRRLREILTWFDHYLRKH